MVLIQNKERFVVDLKCFMVLKQIFDMKNKYVVEMKRNSRLSCKLVCAFR